MSSPPPSRPSASDSSEAEQPLSGIRAFVVDDQRAQVDVVRDLLEDAGAAVVGTTDPVAMSELLQAQTTDILIADVVMPVMDGWELFARMRALPHHQKTPVLFMTFLADPARMDHYTQGDGRCRVISKPFHRVDLIAHVRDMVRGLQNTPGPAEA